MKFFWYYIYIYIYDWCLCSHCIQIVYIVSTHYTRVLYCVNFCLFTFHLYLSTCYISVFCTQGHDEIKHQNTCSKFLWLNLKRYCIKIATLQFLYYLGFMEMVNVNMNVCFCMLKLEVNYRIKRGWWKIKENRIDKFFRDVFFY